MKFFFNVTNAIAFVKNGGNTTFFTYIFLGATFYLEINIEVILYGL